MAMLPERISPKDEAKYPNLVVSGYRKTSEKDPRYNCVAWCADWKTKSWWEPFSSGKAGRHWPKGVPEGFYVENYMQAFGTIGYQVCNSPDLEKGYEKIALYIDDDGMGLFSHVSKQLPDGRWTSKLGGGNDIIHNSLEAFHGNKRHGNPVRFMKRAITGYPLPPNLMKQ